MSAIKQELFYILLKPSGSLGLAELEDGRFCIMHNRQPLTDRYWQRGQVGRAVAAFREIRARFPGANQASPAIKRPH